MQDIFERMQRIISEQFSVDEDEITMDTSFEEELNMFPVLWTVDPLDWCSDNVARIVQKVMSKADENDIILMHDEYKSTVTAALQIIDELMEQGYEFVTVDELLFD